MPDTEIQVLEQQLNSFDSNIRQDALAALWQKAQKGYVEIQPENEIANMHCHTFFSYNGYGYSPTAIAWLAKKNGIKLVGIVDFDVLDGVDEFLIATDILEIRASCGIETRIFIPEFETREINSPGEPGISYHMGIGFVSGSIPETSEDILKTMRVRSTNRNLLMVERLNEYLKPIKIDYEDDVLVLTPKGYATERHILAAMINVVEKTAPDKIGFWAEKLNISQEEAIDLYNDKPKFSNLIRTKLMKKGGIGYIQPDAGSFPKIEEFHTLIDEAKAIPCLTWLDGTSKGEQDIEELVEMTIKKGVMAINIIPDRNWNISDPKVKATKLEKLYQIVEIAKSRYLPINMGTEMNSFGQRLVDDFNAQELAPVIQDFLDGAYFIYGHTLLERAIQKGYRSGWAVEQFPSRKERNEFYTKVGKIAPPGKSTLTYLQQIDDKTITADDILIGLQKR